MDEKRRARPVDARIAAVAARQHGVVALLQLLELGLTYHQVVSRVGRGLLHPIHRGVFAVGYLRPTTSGRRVAALLAVGPGAAISHRQALGVWGVLRPRSTVIELTAVTERRTRRGIRLHCGPLPPEEVTRKDRVLVVTTPARSLLDSACDLPDRLLERTIDEAERLGLLDRRALAATLECNRGRRGRARLVSALESHRPGSTLTRSELEERFLALCRKHGLSQPEVNVEIGPFIVDFLWRDRRLIVETDGRASHATTASFERDRFRDAQLTIAGYRVVRYTWRRVTREPAQVARELRALLD